MTQSILCSIDFNVDDRLKSIQTLVDRLKDWVDLPPSHPVILDLSKCRYLGPYAVTILGALVLDFRRCGISAQLIPPEGPPELISFYRFSGLQKLGEGGGVEERHTEVTEYPVSPLRQLRTARLNDPDPIINMLHRYCKLESEVEEYLRICINEIIQNIEDHAVSSIGGLISARYLSGERSVRVAIVDRGIGICTTLSRRISDTTAENVIPRVLEGHYSAQSRANNMGLGLSNLAAIIKQLEGDLLILSERSIAERRKGSSSHPLMSCRFGGTGVFFSLPVHD